jgi:hypothetical protein
MSAQWYLYRAGQRYGPYAWQDLMAFAQSGNLAPDDLLWGPTTGDWTPAERISGLWPAAPSTPAPVYTTAPATSAPTAAGAAAPKGRRGGLAFVLVFAAVLALGGGAFWFFWLRDGAPRKQQAVVARTPTLALTPTPSTTTSKVFWQSADLEAAIAAMDDGDWRNYADLAAEQAAIGETLGGFGEAMQAGDLDTAVSYILPERQEAYRELFASNPDGMASFGELLDAAEMSFLSEHTDTSAYNRTAEYALELDGFTFYLVFIKTADGWVLYDF